MFEKNLSKGKFEIGCNYWAAHAGIEMWSRWDESVVEDDFKRINEAKIRIVRAFPLWSDFQPIKMHYKYASLESEMRIGEDPLDLTTPEGEAGIDPVMIERFERMCKLAEKYNIKLIIGLLTGWMSGRMFVPSALERLNPITDSEAILWEIKFVRYMVRRFKSEKSIIAWDLGNECNCMGPASKNDLVRWITDISMAIRSEDGTRPVVSGMHGIFPDNTEKPTPMDMKSECDILTTHPYPLFTKYCNTDPLGEMKSALHATAESLLQADTGHRVCIVEEIGTLGQMMASDEVAGYYAQTSCLSSWAHDLRAFIWWCANEQSALVHTPYDWCGVERELGLFRLDGSPKPVGKRLTAVQGFIDSFEAEFGSLPERVIDAVCILTKEQDAWGVAYGTFMLAKQAGLDIQFAYATDVIPDAKVYLMPSMYGTNIMNKWKLEELYKKVENGAVLYMSNDEMLLSDFMRVTGNCVDTRTNTGFAYDVELPCGDKVKLSARANIVMHSEGSEVICRDETGNPAFTVYKYGKGKVYFCNYPIEMIAGTKPGVISGKNALPLYSFYEKMDLRSELKCAKSASPYVGITEHISDKGEHLLVLINYSANDIDTEVKLKDKKLKRFIPFGDKTTALKSESGFKISIERNACAVAVIE